MSKAFWFGLSNQINALPLPENPNKYHITEEDNCPVCFGEIELEIVPCGHGICNTCFARYNDVCCVCRELVATTVDRKHDDKIPR